MEKQHAKSARYAPGQMQRSKHWLRAQKLVRRPKLGAIPTVPNTAFEEDVLLTKEQVRLHIGFNGSTYYTYFQDQAQAQQESNRREYASWEALWSVWQHMSEVQDAFQHSPDAGTKGSQASAKTA